jgi:hypothetical protein
MAYMALDADEVMRTRTRGSPSRPRFRPRDRIRWCRLIRHSRDHGLQTGRAIRVGQDVDIRQGDDGGEWPTEQGRLISLDGSPQQCTITHAPNGPWWIEGATGIVGGMSGSPILAEDGETAIGVVVCASSHAFGTPHRPRAARTRDSLCPCRCWLLCDLGCGTSG